MRLFRGNVVDAFLTRFNIPDDVPIEAKMVSNAIKSAQSQVEAQNFEIRKNVLKYDDVLNRQRTVIYDERRRVLHGEDMHEQVRHMMDDTIEGYVSGATAEGYAEEWDLEKLWTALKAIYPVGVTIDELLAESGGDQSSLDGDFLAERLKTDIQHAYDRREEQIGEELMRELERRVVLSVLDRKWREHLYEMDYLQEGIGLRAMAQRDPLVEYQREGYDMFTAMMEAIKEESVGFLFNVEVKVEGATPEGEEAEVADGAPTVQAVPAGQGGVPAASARPVRPAGGVTSTAPRVLPKGFAQPQRPARLSYSAPTLDGSGGVATASEASGSSPDAAAALGPDATRAERRRWEREQRKLEQREAKKDR